MDQNNWKVLGVGIHSYGPYFAQVGTVTVDIKALDRPFYVFIYLLFAVFDCILIPQIYPVKRIPVRKVSRNEKDGISFLMSLIE